MIRARVQGAALGLASVIVAIGCGVLGWAAVRTWRASADVSTAQDLALRQGSKAAIPYLALAVRYRPRQAHAWRLLARFRAFAHPHAALRDAQKAVAADPVDWRNWDQLGLVQYQLGESAAARRSLARAVERDSGWEAHFQLGSLALLLGKQAEFWREMKAALAVVTPAQAPPVLNEAWGQTNGHAARMLAILPSKRAEVDAEAATLIMDRGAPLAAAHLWEKVRCPQYRFGACRGAVLGLTNRLTGLVFAGSYRGWAPAAMAKTPDKGALVRAAMRMWNEAVRRRIIDASLARPGTVGDGRFERPWIGPAFAWYRAGPVYLSREPGAAPVGAALRIGFDGYQPDNTSLIGQMIAVWPGAEYELSYLSRRGGQGGNSGLVLVVRSAPGLAITRIPARLGPRWRTSEGGFVVPRSCHLVQLVFRFHRPKGQVRMRSAALVADVQLREVRR